MPLSLKAHDPSRPQDAPIEVEMTADTISVGRGADNDLVLPDPDRVLSKRHCLLEKQGAGYVVKDVSTNGTFLNYQGDRLGDVPAPLSSGDVILVGAFELVVEITTAGQEPAILVGALGRSSSNKAPAPFAGVEEDDTGLLDELLGGPAAGNHSDPFDPSPCGTAQPSASVSDHTPVERDHFAAPHARKAIIPDDWNSSQVTPRATELSAAAPASPGGHGDVAMRAFLAGLGVNDLQVPPDQAEEVMGRMGRVMAAMITGLREVMLTRAALKSEMRVTRTMIEASDNNPLKFSVTAEQAITAMLRPAGQGYQDPETASAEVLRDIKAHEVATIAGMQAALTDLLKQLGPEQLSARIETTSRLGGLLGNRKARLWEAYEQHYTQLARQTEDDFQSTFGKEFSRAYENQITKL